MGDTLKRALFHAVSDEIESAVRKYRNPAFRFIFPVDIRAEVAASFRRKIHRKTITDYRPVHRFGQAFHWRTRQYGSDLYIYRSLLKRDKSGRVVDMSELPERRVTRDRMVEVRDLGIGSIVVVIYVKPKFKWSSIFSRWRSKNERSYL